MQNKPSTKSSVFIFPLLFHCMHCWLFEYVHQVTYLTAFFIEQPTNIFHQAINNQEKTLVSIITSAGAAPDIKTRYP